jgi:hypothetical protein
MIANELALIGEKEEDKMKKSVYITLIVCLAVVLYTLSCGTKEKTTEGEYPAVIEDINGIQTIHNPDYPKEGTFRYDLVPELILGGPDAEGDAVLVRPIEFQFDSQENIYIIDWREITIKVFDPDGNYLRSVSKQGPGPGEFDIPAHFRIVDDQIYLLDSHYRKFSLLALEGEYLKGFNIEGYPLQFDVAPDGTVYYAQRLETEVEGGEKMQRMSASFVLIQTNASGEDRKKIGEFKGQDSLRKLTKLSSGQSMMITQSSREAYTTSWLVGPKGNIYLGYNQNYELEVRDEEWNLLKNFSRDFTPLPHPDYSPEGPHPKFYPAFSDWRKFFDDQGNLWLELYPIPDEGDHAFDVFSPDGIYLKKVIVPKVLFEVKGKTAYGFQRDEEGYVTFHRYKMVPIKE